MIKIRISTVLSLLVFVGVTFLLILLPTTRMNSSVKNIEDKLKGKILIQIESKGEAWYLNPSDLKRYHIDHSPASWQLLKRLSTKIKTDDWQKIKENIPSEYWGKFLLIEDIGNILYISPNSGKIYTLTNPADIFTLLQKTGLGISNKDLKQIPTGINTYE